jgi:hypothetical protein
MLSIGRATDYHPIIAAGGALPHPLRDCFNHFVSAVDQIQYLRGSWLLVFIVIT